MHMALNAHSISMHIISGNPYSCPGKKLIIFSMLQTRNQSSEAEITGLDASVLYLGSHPELWSIRNAPTSSKLPISYAGRYRSHRASRKCVLGKCIKPTCWQANKTGPVANPSFRSAEVGLPICSEQEVKSRTSSISWRGRKGCHSPATPVSPPPCPLDRTPPEQQTNLKSDAHVLPVLIGNLMHRWVRASQDRDLKQRIPR